jgi:hypothetical protein
MLRHSPKPVEPEATKPLHPKLHTPYIPSTLYTSYIRVHSTTSKHHCFDPHSYTSHRAHHPPFPHQTEPRCLPHLPSHLPPRPCIYHGLVKLIYEWPVHCKKLPVGSQRSRPIQRRRLFSHLWPMGCLHRPSTLGQCISTKRGTGERHEGPEYRR